MPVPAPTLEKMNQLITECKNNDKITVKVAELPTSHEKFIVELYGESVKTDLLSTSYQYADGFKLEWHSIADKNEGIMGSIKIQPLMDLGQNWGFEDDDPKLKDFQVYDFFIEETVVGFHKGLDYLYIYSMADETIHLSLDMNGYLEMALEAKGFLYWQNIVLGFKNNEENPHMEEYEKYMPQLFPGTSLAKLRETYERVKIK